MFCERRADYVAERERANVVILPNSGRIESTDKCHLMRRRSLFGFNNTVRVLHHPLDRFHGEAVVIVKTSVEKLVIVAWYSNRHCLCAPLRPLQRMRRTCLVFDAMVNTRPRPVETTKQCLFISGVLCNLPTTSKFRHPLPPNKTAER